MASSEFQTNTALRHAPKQIRGQKKVEHILRCAESLFAEVGFENTTTNAIALRANVSIGSLYQFFSGKDTILETMADRYLEQTRVMLSRTLESKDSFELDDLLTKLIDSSIKLQEQRPYFLQCLRHSSPSPAVTQAVDKLTEGMAERVQLLLERATADPDPKVLRLRATICVETVGALLPVAMRVKGRERARATGEIKMLLTRYLEPTLKRKGVI